MVSVSFWGNLVTLQFGCGRCQCVGFTIGSEGESAWTNQGINQGSITLPTFPTMAQKSKNKIID